jgi:predicted GNAT superfamily acetyltransferase
MTRPEDLRKMDTVTETALTPHLGAVRDGERAAAAAGVVVRELTELADLDQVLHLYVRVWGRSANPPMTLELLRALTKAGNYVGGAFLPDGRLVGACVGFFHAPADDAMHSHIAAVDPVMTGRSVGFAVKLHQRAWALQRGVSDVAWTFDPLVSRNAHFNLVKLAARPVEYLPNFYGPMVDLINGADDTDRLLVRWRLLSPAVERACSPDAVATPEPVPPGAVAAVGLGSDGAPVPGRMGAEVSLVAVPDDISALRTSDPDLAHRWRTTVRDVLSELLADGARITSFDRTAGYVVRRTP